MLFNINAWYLLLSIINRFPRSYKFTLGDRLQLHLSDLMELYIKAYYTPTHAKRSLLNEANIKIEIIRHHYRLAFELGLYHSNKYRQLAEQLDEIGRMTGGWIKTLPK